MIKKYRIIILLIILLFLLIISLIRFYGEKKFFHDNSCKSPMLWLHAVGNKERMERISQNKYCGVEIDTTYSSDRGLIASYNKPNDKNALRIEEIIYNNTNIKYWWLDFKNLNSSNAKQISKLIKNLSSKFTENIFLVESNNFVGLWFLNTDADEIYKIYWLAKGPYKNNQIHASTPLYLLRAILANIIIDPDFVSMFHYQVNNVDFLWVGNRQKFAFTINSLETYNKMSDMGVSVLLTDNIDLLSKK